MTMPLVLEKRDLPAGCRLTTLGGVRPTRVYWGTLVFKPLKEADQSSPRARPVLRRPMRLGVPEMD
jgi:hypothetical protein